MSRIASLLADSRRRAGLSQRALATLTGLPQASISRIERGQVAPRTTTVERWLAACGLEPDVRRPSGSVDRSLIRERLAMTPIERSRRGVAEARALRAFERGHLTRDPGS